MFGAPSIISDFYESHARVATLVRIFAESVTFLVCVSVARSSKLSRATVAAATATVAVCCKPGTLYKLLG